MPHVGLSMMPEQAFLEATLPLFDTGEVEALEWSFDMGWKDENADWLEGILNEYSKAGRLTGHGVHFSLLSAKWTPRHQGWIEKLDRELSQRDYLHITEHFGFMTAGDFHHGAPLPVPMTPETLELGQQRFAQLAEVTSQHQLSLGLENLALALTKQDVLEHNAFLQKIVAPSDGFLLLDLHNVYCQMHNFGIGPTEMFSNYPFELVREIHVSGGSWAETPSSTIPVRRDTHDDAVPEEVFALLQFVLPQCQNLDVIFLERLGNTLADPVSHAPFRNDFAKLKSLVHHG